MKKVFLFAFISMIAWVMKAENTDISDMDNVVYIEPCTAEAGSEYVLSVKMKNSIVAESFGFDLVLPEGITVALDEYGDPVAVLSMERTNDNITDQFGADFKLDGSLNIQAYSSKGRSISGNDGEVCLITVNIAANMTRGTYPLLLKNIAISDVNSVTYTEDLVESSIVIVGGGDVNGDNVIDALDASLILQYVAHKFGDENTDFIKAAADTNNDNVIDALDASLVLQHAAKKIDLNEINTTE